MAPGDPKNGVREKPEEMENLELERERGKNHGALLLENLADVVTRRRRQRQDYRLPHRSICKKTELRAKRRTIGRSEMSGFGSDGFGVDSRASSRSVLSFL